MPSFTAARTVCSVLSRITGYPGLPLIGSCHLCHSRKSQRQAGLSFPSLLPTGKAQTEAGLEPVSSRIASHPSVSSPASNLASPNPHLASVSNTVLWTSNHPPTHLLPNHPPSHRLPAIPAAVNVPHMCHLPATHAPSHLTWKIPLV